MSDKKNISAAFVKAQKSFAPALKSSSNPHFRSKYADLAACVEAVIDALNSQGIALTQPTHEAEGGVMVETLFLHESGETMSGGKLFLPASKQDAQGYGSALTYARRYSLMAACGIAPEDDDGNAATKSAPKVQAKPKPAPQAPALDLTDSIVAMGECSSIEQLKATFGKFWSIAAEDQKAELKNAYDGYKAGFEEQTA